MSTTKTIIVIGGGLGGMAAALALSRKGFEVTLLEQAEEFGEVGAGIQNGPNVMKMFDRLGVLDEIRAVAFFPKSLRLMDAIDGNQVTEIELGQKFEERFGYPYATLHRADLHAVLTAACERSETVTLVKKHRVTSFSQDRSGVAVTCEATGDTFTADALVAADGIWSPTREAIIGDGRPRVVGQVAYRAVVPVTEIDPELYSDSVTIWAGPKLHFAHYPIRRGELMTMGSIFHSRKFDSGANEFGDADELAEQFTGVTDRVSALLEKIETWRMWVLHDRDPVDGSRWVQGRVALLGDSAHPTLQYLAQGAAMAIEDAWYLAEIADQHRNDVPGWLSHYAAARSERTARVTLMSRLYGQLYHAEGMERMVRRQMLTGWTGPRTHEHFAWLYDGI